MGPILAQIGPVVAHAEAFRGPASACLFALLLLTWGTCSRALVATHRRARAQRQRQQSWEGRAGRKRARGSRRCGCVALWRVRMVSGSPHLLVVERLLLTDTHQSTSTPLQDAYAFTTALRIGRASTQAPAVAYVHCNFISPP